MLEKIKEILNNYHYDVSNISEDTALISDLGLNSLHIMQLACDIEDTFDVEIPDRAIKEIKTIGDVMRLIEELK